MNHNYFDPVSRVYTHTLEAQQDPEASKKSGGFVPLALPFTTLKPLPELQQDQVAQFDIAAKDWVAVESHVAKTIYSTTDKSEQSVTDVGPVPAGYTLQKPAEFDVWLDRAWQRDDTAYFASKLSAKVSYINAACSAAIVSGFESKGLGARHTYSAERDDQLNIAGCVVDATMGEGSYYACVDVGGDRNFRFHKPAQMIAVGRDLKAHKFACLKKAGLLKAQAAAAAAAADDAAMSAVVWSD